MKKLMKMIFVISIMVLAVTCTNTGAELKDNAGPKCSIEIYGKVRLGSTTTGKIICYDENKLTDNKINASDIKVSNSLIGKIKVVSISNEYIDINNPYYHIWQIKIKGLILGNNNFQLKRNSITDINGNYNEPSTTAKIKVIF